MAKSSYTDELAAWIQKREATKRRQDAATVAFLAVRGDVATAIESGYAITTIYEHMHTIGRVTCSYETFRKHVQRYIVQAPATTPRSSPVPTAGPAATGETRKGAPGQKENGGPPGQQQRIEPKSTSNPPKIGGFSFDATPKAEDLL
jgi:hypothetical protein